MKEQTVLRIREFNRFYMPAFDLLGNSYLGSEYSAAEARVLYEIYNHEGCLASDISKTLHIDKSYLSRTIKHHEKQGYLTRTPSKADSRAYELSLTEQGRKRTEDFIRKSNAQIGEKIGDLNLDECRRLMEAFDTITELLGGKA